MSPMKETTTPEVVRAVQDNDTLDWLAAGLRVLQRTDRILAQNPDIKTTLELAGPAPAWSDGRNIYIRAGERGLTWKDRSTQRLLGLNYHELAHILLTPRFDSEAWHAVQRAGLLSTFNMAEDGRIETLFTSLYSPSIPFFCAAVADLILHPRRHGASPDIMESSWLLLAGRRYLPKHVRRASRAAFFGDADRVKALMDRYLILDWDTEITLGIEILTELRDILGSRPQPTGTHPGAEPAAGEIDREAQADAIDALSDDDIDEPDEEEAEAEAEAEGDTDTDIEGDTDTEGEADTDTDTEGEGEGEGEADTEAEGEGEADTEAEGDTEAGVSAGTESGETTEALLEAVKALLQQAEAEMEGLVELTAEQIEAEIEDGAEALGESYRPRDKRIEVTAAARSMESDLEAVLADLRFLVDPGIVTHQPQGRINPGRYLLREPWEGLDELFDEYRAGAEEALDLDIVLMVDVSGSMGGWYDAQGLTIRREPGDTPARVVAENVWALKRALQRHGVPLTVVGFDTSNHLFYGRDDEALEDWMIAPMAEGGTTPGEMLIDIARYFRRSTHPHRVLITLTDGTWNARFSAGMMPSLGFESLAHAQLIEAIDAQVKVLVDYGGKANNSEGWTHHFVTQDPEALVGIVRETIVEGVMAAIRDWT